MPKETYIARFALIIKRLEQGPATFEQIAKYLDRESDIQDKDYRISKRTLQRDIQHINSQLHIEIANKKKGDNRYYIKDDSEVHEQGQRLLESYQIINAIHAAQDNGEYVFLENRKSKGLEHFYGLLYAIKNKKVLKFNHYKYEDQMLTQRTVHPLALKEAQGRWYLVAVDTKDDKLKTFGLDRMQDIDITKAAIRIKYSYDIKELFKHSFGIINDEHENPQKIRLSFNYEQGQYINNYPLHHSQKIIEENSEEVVFELFMKVSYDFEMELLSYGAEVRVIAPATLRKAMRRHYENALKKTNLT
ncbi:MAG TPA: WYL domain-containing protein [Parafilimonas sp.]|nr:WYL domain-containing protein [Parafilimonas sp.]